MLRAHSASSFSLASRLRLRFDPYRICIQTKIKLASMIPHSKVKVHPIPISFTIGRTAAVPPAANKHRTRFNAAVAEAPCFGKQSTMKVVTTLIIEVEAHPTMNVHMIGTDM